VTFLSQNCRAFPPKPSLPGYLAHEVEPHSAGNSLRIALQNRLNRLIVTDAASSGEDGLPKSTLDVFGQAERGFLRIVGSLHRPFGPTRFLSDFAP
jgi:hypothetical protein